MPTPYITYGGDLTIQPPFQLDHASMYCFVFQSDCQKLQTILDKRLNFPPHGKRYTVFSSQIMVIFADTPHAYSVSEPEQGFITMNEAVFWILAVEQEFVDNQWKSKRLVWFIPYIFVDNPVELIAGREVAGFPKALAEVIIPKNFHYAHSFSINTCAYAKFGVHSHFVNHHLLSIQSVGLNKNTTQEFTGYRKFLRTLKNTIKGLKCGKMGLCKDVLQEKGEFRRVIRQLLSDWCSAKMSAIFLKQFRSASNDGNACYQALIESSFVITRFQSFSLLNDQNYVLHIHHLDSFPLIEDLGLYDGQKPLYALWVNMSFTNTAGQEIWVAD